MGFPSARFLGAVLWSPVLGRRDLVSLVESVVAESTVPRVRSRLTIHAPEGLSGSSFPSSSRVGSFGWTDQGRFILSVLVGGSSEGPLRALERLLERSPMQTPGYGSGEPCPCTYSRCIENCRWNAVKRKDGWGMKGGLGLR